MKTPPPLDTISERTLGHYETHATSFWAGTRDHDVSQNYQALLNALDGERRRLRILDFGCGPGRDLKFFQELGHEAVGLDGCAAFVEMARTHSGCDVLHQSFFALELPPLRFDGVFANASLFHVPRALLPRVLQQLKETLVPGGVLFCSNPRSFDDDREGWQGERYGTYLTRESWAELIRNAGFSLERQFLRPEGKPCTEQPWLAMVWRNPPEGNAP
ncbi:MAG TPA: class I SAM-dependent methyltransferase [Polyangiaceae bacterium]|nr:class I SAM-dependent methyltransferase [Polyangiaceae bacterium]